jgi:hypothetical protein
MNFYGRLEPIGGVIEDLTRQIGIQQGLKLEKIRAAWLDLFKPPFGEKFSPEDFSNGRLIVHCYNNQWLTSINYYRKDVLAKLKPYGVEALTLRVGEVTAAEPPVTSPRSKQLKPWPPGGQDATDIEELTRHLPDGIREAAAKAIARSFGYVDDKAV